MLYIVYIQEMDFYKIGALKVFAELGALIEEDERTQIKFMDLPTDIIQINISKYLTPLPCISYTGIQTEIFGLLFIIKMLP